MLEHDINMFTAGVLSEPGTPPDHQKLSMQPPFANRFSTSTMASPGIVSNHQSRPVSQIMSPPTDFNNPYFPAQNIPSQSVPGSQRNSDHEESDEDHTFAYPAIKQKAGAKYVIISDMPCLFSLALVSRLSAHKGCLIVCDWFTACAASPSLQTRSLHLHFPSHLIVSSPPLSSHLSTSKCLVLSS